LWHEPLRALAANLLERVADTHANELAGVREALEQLFQPAPVVEHDVDDLLGPAERVGMTACEHDGEWLGHEIGFGDSRGCAVLATSSDLRASRF
jgi:hypothetical protein